MKSYKCVRRYKLTRLASFHSARIVVLTRFASQRRQQLWALYLLRAPLFQSMSGLFDATLPTQRLASLPLVGSLLVSARQYVQFYADHYFYSSGS